MHIAHLAPGCLANEGYRKPFAASREKATATHSFDMQGIASYTVYGGQSNITAASLFFPQGSIGRDTGDSVGRDAAGAYTNDSTYGSVVPPIARSERMYAPTGKQRSVCESSGQS